MASLVEGRICHATPHRVRIKIPAKRGDAGFFDHVERSLSNWKSVDGVEVSPLTGSILIRFHDAVALLTENAARNDMFSVTFPETEAGPIELLTRKPIVEQAREALKAADRTVRNWTGAQADLKSLILIAILAAALRQFARGRIAGPVTTLLWQAGTLIGLQNLSSSDSMARPSRNAAPRPHSPQ
jgi:hypothetical protein